MTTLPTPSDFVKEYAPWSYSKLDTLKQCPWRFQQAYVVKAKRGRPNSDALVGQAIHTVLEYMLSGRSWEVAYEGAVAKYDLTSPEISRVVDVEFTAKNFITKIEKYKQKHQIGDSWIEYKLGVDIEGNAVKFFDPRVFFRGVVDLALFPKHENHVIVIDHKTGKRRPLHYFERQFDCYLILARASLPKLVAGHVGIHWTVDDAVELSKKTRQLTDVAPHWENMIQWLNGTTEGNHDFERTCRGPLCGWCDYQSKCPEFNQGSNTDNGCGKENAK